MAISSNEIKIKYVIDDSDLRKAQQGFDKLTAEEQDAINQLKKFNSELDKTGSTAYDTGNKLSGAFDKAQGGLQGFINKLGPVGPAIAGAFSVQAVISFAKAVFDVTANFEKMASVLKNQLGSGAQASIVLENIKNFAKTTPFSVQELTDSFIKLNGAGVRPTIDQMRKLGDVASSQGKSFIQLSEAILDARNFEFERLKELNINARTVGDNLIFTFNNVQTTVKKNRDAVTEYIYSLGEYNGVAGASAAVSETLGGKVNNLGDAWDEFLNQIGTLLAPTLQSALELTSDFMAGINAIFSVGKSEAKKNADLEVDAYKGAKGRISKLTDEQLQAELKANNEKLKSLNSVAGEYDKTSKTISKYGTLIKFMTLGVYDLSAAEAVRSSTIGREAKAAKEQKAALDGVNGAINEELKLRAEQKRKQDEAAPNKDAQAKEDKKSYELRLKQLELEKQIMTLQAQLRGSKLGELGAEKNFAQEVYNLKKQYSDKGIGITENEVKVAKLTADLKAKAFEDGAKNEYLIAITLQDRIDKAKKETDDADKKSYEDRLARMKKWQKAYEAGHEEEVQKKKEAEEMKQAVTQKTLELGQELVSGGFNLYQQGLDRELSATQKLYDEKIRLADGNKQKIQEIEAERAAKEREIKTKQFRADQLAAIANIWFNAAPQIVKYGANPTTIPLAILTAALATAQTGFVVAQQVPEFAEGTKGKPFEGGKAIVGERGVEKVVTQSGKVYFTPPTATLVDLPKGSQVIPNHALSKQELFLASHYANRSSSVSSPVVGKLDELSGILKSLPITQLNMDERGFEKYIRTPRRTTKILNNRFRNAS